MGKKRNRKGSGDGCESKEAPVGLKFHKHAEETHLMEEDDPDAYSRM